MDIKNTQYISSQCNNADNESTYNLNHIDNKFQLISANHEYKRNDSSAVHPGL